MRTPVSSFSPRRNQQAGLSLIELMIAVLLGLLVVAAGMGLLLSNRRTYGTTQALSRIQENQRLAFDMLSADIRSAGDYPCAALARPGRVVAQVDTGRINSPNVGTLIEWDAYFEQLRAGINEEMRFEGPLLVIGTTYGLHSGYLDPAESMGYRYAVLSHDSPEAPITIRDAGIFRQNKVYREDAVICNADRAVVFHASQVTDAHEIYHQAGPVADLRNPSAIDRKHSNCGTAFVYDPAQRTELRAALDQGKCGQEVASPGGNNRYCFGPDAKAGEKGCDRVGNSQAFVLPSFSYERIRWYIRENLHGGSKKSLSLYRDTGRGVEEILDGIERIEFKYRLYGETDYHSAAVIDPDYSTPLHQRAYNPRWGRVDSVYIKMEFEAPESSGLGKGDTQGTDGNALSRTLEGYVMIRNRLRNQPDGG